MVCLGGMLLNSQYSIEYSHTSAPPLISTKSVQLHDDGKPLLGSLQTTPLTGATEPLPVFRPGDLCPWAPGEPGAVDLCASSTLAFWGSAVAKWQYRKDICLGIHSKLENTVECWKLTSWEHDIICFLPAASCHGRHSDHLLVLFCARRLQIITAFTVLLPHFRCYYYHFHFCFWNILGTTVLWILSLVLNLHSHASLTLVLNGYSSPFQSLGTRKGEVPVLPISPEFH